MNSGLFSEVFQAFRPKTLTAALVPCLVSSAWVLHSGQNFDGWSLVFALVSAFSIQIATNLVNDAVDFKKGADNEKRIGPRRITQSGVLSEQKVLRLGFAFVLVAIICGIPLVLRGGMPILLIGLCSAFLAYGYTGGPFPLAYLGLGDVFVVLFFGIIAVLGMSYLHTLHWDFQSLWIGLQVGFHAAVLIAINNLRDTKTDALVGKKTWAVRFGVELYRKEIFFLIWAPFVMNIYWFFHGSYGAGSLPLILIPLAILLTKRIFHTPPSAVYNQFLATAALLHFAFGLLMSAGFLWL